MRKGKKSIQEFADDIARAIRPRASLRVPTHWTQWRSRLCEHFNMPTQGQKPADPLRLM